MVISKDEILKLIDKRTTLQRVRATDTSRGIYSVILDDDHPDKGTERDPVVSLINHLQLGGTLGAWAEAGGLMASTVRQWRTEAKAALRKINEYEQQLIDEGVPDNLIEQYLDEFLRTKFTPAIPKKLEFLHYSTIGMGRFEVEGMKYMEQFFTDEDKDSEAKAKFWFKLAGIRRGDWSGMNVPVQVEHRLVDTGNTVKELNELLNDSTLEAATERIQDKHND